MNQTGEKREPTITKKELVDRIAEKTKIKRIAVKTVIQSFLDEITNELARGSRLEFRDFGVFKTKQRKARAAQNPKTMEKVQVPPKRTVAFKVGRLMKIKLQEGMGRQRPAQAQPQRPPTTPKPVPAPPSRGPQASAEP